MRHLLILVTVALCTACGSRIVIDPASRYPEAPAIPDLPDDLKKPCPELPLIKDGSIEALSVADVKSSLLYKSCKSKQSEVVERYYQVKREQDSHRRQVEAVKAIIATDQKK